MDSGSRNRINPKTVRSDLQVLRLHGPDASIGVAHEGNPSSFNLPYYSPGCEVIGIDLSPGMLEKAREKVMEAKVPVKLLEMDAQNLQFQDHHFDTVLATCVFCSVPDPIKGLQEIRRVCKPNGKVILLEHVRSEHPLLGKIMDILDPLTVRMMGPHINRRTVENVRAAGLTVKSVEDQYVKILKLIVAEP